MHEEPSIISGTVAAICSKTNFRSPGHLHPRSSPLPRVSTVPTVLRKSWSVWMFSTAYDSALISSIASKWRPSITFIRETEKSRAGEGRRSCCFWLKIRRRKRSVRWCFGATCSSFVAKVKGEVFSHFHAVCVKRHSSMRNCLFGLPGRILREQSPWCQMKCWACSWLCSSPASHFPVSVSLDFPCTAHAVFLDRVSNHCHGLRRTFSKFCT
jgi:hypothetical protein